MFSEGELLLGVGGTTDEVAPDAAASLAVTPDASGNHLMWGESSEEWCFDAALGRDDALLAVEDSPLLL